MFPSFIKDGKECKKHSVLYKRTEKNARKLRFFEKNGCPTLLNFEVKVSQRYFIWPLLRL